MSADEYRDGGSYSATFATDDGLPLSIFLQRSRMPDREGRHHRALYEYRGESMPDGCRSVLSGSQEERRLLRLVDEFLARVDVSASPSRSLVRLREMRVCIDRRDAADSVETWTRPTPRPPSPPTPEQSRRLYDALGAEQPDTTCRSHDCIRGAVEFSVFCRKHHYESIYDEPCPFEP
jgi:hypothetical protein